MCIKGSKRVVFEGGSRGPPPELCLKGSKRVVFEGGSRSPPPELFLAVFIQNGAPREDAGGLKSRIRPPYPQRVVKGD